MASIGQNIKSLRESLGMSQEKLGNLVGVSRSCVSQWESGETKPKMGKIEKLSGVFGVPVSSIVEGREDTELSIDEVLLLNAYRNMDEESKKAISYFIIKLDSR